MTSLLPKKNRQLEVKNMVLNAIRDDNFESIPILGVNKNL